MCGIFGYIGNIQKDLAEKCTDAIEHRGPDGGGIWCGNGITLGHRRLSILDLSPLGAQPMSYADGRYWIVFNGEIYNFIELRSELEGKGYAFASNSDTEVILAAFIEWGAGCQLRFNGMWALAIWDQQERKLFLSRDRFGIKPLFYIRRGNNYAFASEMKALFPLMDSIEPNMHITRDNCRIFHYESTSECVIRDINRFPAGHCGWIENGRLEIQRWWCTLDHLMDVPKSYQEQVEQFRSLFMDACKIRMRSDVSIGTALSGGLDSSAVIAGLSNVSKSIHGERINEDWQHAFVASFPGTPLDETQYAKMVTDHLQIKINALNIQPLDAIHRMNEYYYLFEDLYLTSPIPFMMTYQAIKKNGITVSIDGHGADELFGGYTSGFINALKDAGIHMKQIKMILDTFYDSMPKDSSQFQMVQPKYEFFTKWYVKEFIKKLKGNPYALHMDWDHPRWKGLDHLTRHLYASTHEDVLPTLLRNYDRYSMANSVEIRMPFMDYRIVAFAFSIPWSSKIRNHYSKAIVRDAIAPFLPKEIVYRKTKVGFNSPVVDWMKGPLKQFFMDMIHSKSFNECTLINPAEVKEKIEYVINTPNVPFYKGEQAWIAINPYFWEQALIKNRQIGK